jgi:tetratricopeptide (TPR) repeat protein
MRRVGIVVLLGLLVLPAGMAVAADESVEPGIDLEELSALRKVRQRKNPASKRVERYGVAAMEVLSQDEGGSQGARELLKRLNLKRLNPYERALIYRLLGYVSYDAEELHETIQNFSNALAEEILPLKEESELRFNIAQLYAALSQWRDVVDSIDLWALYVPERTPLSHYLMAIAYYQLDQDDEAIRHVEIAVELAPEPKEGWLQLLAALYVRKQDYKSAAPVLEEMVMRFRKKQYWAQLSLIYGAIDDFRGSLAVQQIAYVQGLLTEDKELRRLARGYLFNDLPHPAALVLKNGMAGGGIEPNAAAYELLANSWIAAREYDESLVPLRKAASLSEDGDLYVRLGQVHMQREEWNEAVRLFQQAVSKGDLTEPGNAHLLLGISQYNDESVARARASFLLARKHESSRSQADAWIQHLESEGRQAS